MGLGQEILKLQNVSKHFPKQGGTVQILRDIHLIVRKGELVTIVGPSGCGKSTLLAGIGGFRPFSSGTAEINLNGNWKPLKSPDRHRGIIFQDYPVPPFLKAVDNVAFGLNLDRLSFLENCLPFLARNQKKKNQEEAKEFLRAVDLADHTEKYPKELSGGQRQRVAIAQAMATHPDILLMDEPFSGLDPRSRENLQGIVQKLHRQLQNTIFFVTHDLEEAIYLGTRIVVLTQYENHPGQQGATIVHEQELMEFKTPESKSSPEFVKLLAQIRAKFKDR